jgi:hypothetical protein
VYALGLTLYELLTLRPAYAAESRAKLIEQVLAAAPPRPRAVNPQVPRDLETIVLKAIARDPGMRYQSAAELADDLRRFTEDRPIRARRASSSEQAWRWCRRNPAVAGLLAALLTVFAGGAGLSAAFAVRAEQAEGTARTAAEEARRDRDRANTKAGELKAEQGLLQAEQGRVRRLLYVSQMNHAAVALAEGRIGRLFELLRETTPRPGELDLRGWEWHYLDRLTRPTGRAFPLGTGATPTPGTRGLSVASFSGDGTRVARSIPEAGGYRFTVWEVATGRPVARLPAAGPALIPVSDTPGSTHPIPLLSPDGRTLSAWTGGAADFRVWDIDSGQELPCPNPCSRPA